MQKSFIKSILVVALTILSAAITPNTYAQLTSTGMTGVVRGNDGKNLAGAQVTAVHTPTNASFTATANNDGRYYFRGLPAGGPYTLTASADGGYQGQPINEVYTQLGTDVDVDIVLKSEVVQMEKFTVTGDRNALDSGATGAGSSMSSDQIANRPTSERSLADMISASSLVTLRSTFGDREESQITAAGQNNRFNSIQIDGSRINDLFGLNGTGLASFFNPLSLDTIEQLAVQLSPYDVRQAGFTGASINAVTKSGTNQYKGSVSMIYRGDHMLGFETQGPNGRDLVNTGTKFIPRLERSTLGATFGGPILKNRLFFFLSYEDFESIIAGRDPRFSTPLEGQILQRLGQISQAAGRTINWGNPVTGQTSNRSENKIKTAKVDWQINGDHRMTLRYTATEGEVPQFGNFASSSLTQNNITGGVLTSSDGHFYAQTREEETYAFTLNSQWTPSLKTEIKYSQTTQDQLTPINTVAPQILITGVTGTDLLNNTAVSNGSYMVGTEQFRQGNVIQVESSQMSATADYVWGNYLFTAGFEREQTDFYNLFRQGSYGLVSFPNFNAFLTDTGAVITRNVYDPNFRPVADISELATTGIFAQARWDYSPRLTFVGGLRYEFAESGITPALNQPFLNTTGFRNDGTMDGTNAISPRFGFNWALDDERRTQVRGGFGHFFGRAPWVIFSNSYGQTGVGGFTLTSAAAQLPTTLTGYLQQFDPASPIGIAADNPADPTRRREINWFDNGTALPQTWRGNLAVEHRLDFLNSKVTLEAVQTENDKALFITNENIRSIGTGADGRARFAGAPSAGVGANARFAAYTDLLRVRNVKAGSSTYVTFQWERPIRNKWGFNLSYTRGKATDAQAIGQTTAGGQWNRNVVFNQNTVEVATSDFEIKDRVQISLIRQFEFVKNWRTTASINYEGRTGNPYSWTYSQDLNGDGRTDNDTVAVPSGTTDPRFDFSGMTQTQIDSYFAFLNTSGLSNYAGGIAPKNAWYEPWVNRLDLRIAQDVPLYGKARMQFAMDFVNFGAFISRKTFGYTEIAPNLSNDVFRSRRLGGAAYGADGRIRPTFTAQPFGFNIDNGMSRWRVQLTAKLMF